jgi:hypothetical protein
MHCLSMRSSVAAASCKMEGDGAAAVADVAEAKLL